MNKLQVLGNLKKIIIQHKIVIIGAF